VGSAARRATSVVVGLLALGVVAWLVLGSERLARHVTGAGGDASEATLYCSVDQDQFQPIVEEIQKETGLRVTSLGETEASRSLGRAQALYMEREHPVADVFWGNEIMNTVVLRDAGVLAGLPKGVAEEFPPAWRDPKGTYVAFAARARVLLVNTKLLPMSKDRPTSVDDLLDPRFGGEGKRIAVAKPLTGTTFTHAVALLVRDEAKGRAFWQAVAARAAKGEIKAVPGNGAVMQLVKDEENGIAFGLTDTDDARVAVKEGAPVEIVFPDQADGRAGTCVIPNTVAIVKGAPHPEAAERLLRRIVSKDVERRLAEGPSANMPVRDDVKAPADVKRPGVDFRAMEVDWGKVGAERDRWAAFLQPLFER
jgi:iron(III) transport system substrate-binding protein